MIQTICKRFSGAIRFIKIGVMAAVLFVGVNEGIKGQTCPEITSDRGININRVDPLASCAPLDYRVTANYQVKYNGCSYNANNVKFHVIWGDGTTSDIPANSPSVTVTDQGTTVEGHFYRFDLSTIHPYPKEIVTCSYKIQVYFVDNNKQLLPFQETDAIVYHQTDTYSGQRELSLVDEKLGENVFLVCEGQEVKIKFKDVTELNCNPSADEGFTKNTFTRHLQFGYGEGGANTITEVYVRNGSGDVTQVVNGGVTTIRYDGGDGNTANTTWATGNPAPTVTGRLSNEIYIPPYVTVDKQEFYITLHNWNKCNYFPGDRTQSVHNFAIIRVVKSPPKPVDKTYKYCYNSSSYAITLDHSPGTMTGGKYDWYEDDGSGTGPAVNAIPFLTTTSKNFNPTSQTGSARLNPTVAQRKIYWVRYTWTNPAGGLNPYAQLCESPYAKIVFENREELKALEIDKKFTICPGVVTRIYADGVTGSSAPNMPIGGQIKYIWKTSATADTVQTGPNGSWADVIFKGTPPNAPASGSATISVYRQWATAPNCPSPQWTFSIQVNPIPKASLTGGGEVCAGESINLTVSQITGLGSNKEFKIKFTGQPETTETFTASPGSKQIPVTPTPGTITQFKLESVTDVGTGCVNTSFTQIATVKARPELKFPTTASLDGPSPVCEGQEYPYTLTNAANPAPSQTMSGTGVPTETLPTRYVWTLDGTAATPPSNETTDNFKNINVLAATDASTPANKVVAASWQYTTQTATTKSFCPVNLVKNIVVNPAPKAKVITPNRTVCANSGTTIDVEISGLPGQTWEFQWQINGGTPQPVTPITVVDAGNDGKETVPVTVPSSMIPNGGTTYTFTIANVKNRTAQPESSCNGIPSGQASIYVLRNPTATTSSDITECEDTDISVPVTITGENSGSFIIEYQTRQVRTNTLSPVLYSDEILYDSNAGGLYTFIVNKQYIDQETADTEVILSYVTQTTTGLDGNSYPCRVAASGIFTIHNIKNAGAALISTPDPNTCGLPLAPGLSISGNAAPSGYTGKWTVLSDPNGAGWYFDGTPGTITSTLNNTTFMPNYGGIYTLQWEISPDVAGTCPPSKATRTLTWGVTPGDPEAGPNANWCYDVNDRQTYKYILAANKADPTQEIGRWKQVGGPGTATFEDNTKNSSSVTVDVYGSYLFRWTFSSGNCPAKSDSVTIVFNEIPRFTNVLPANIAFCPGDAMGAAGGMMPTFASTPVGDYTWRFNGTAMTGIATSGSGQFPNVLAPDNFTASSKPYQLIVRTTVPATGCYSESTVDINLKPKPQLVAPPTEVCAGTSIDFKISPVMGQPVTYDWTNTNTTTGLTPSPGSAQPASPYVYTFKARNSTNVQIQGNVHLTATVNGCVSAPLDFTLKVNPIPRITTIPTSPLQKCPGTLVPETETAFKSDVDGTNYTWTYSGVNIGFGASATGHSTNLPEFSAIENTGNTAIGGTVQITGNAAGCIADSAFRIEVKPRPLVNGLATQTVCPKPDGSGTVFNDLLFTTANSPGAVTYTWDLYTEGVHELGPNPDNVLFSTMPPLDDNISGDNISNQVIVTGTANGCTSDPVTVNLITKPRPVTLSIANQIRCPGQVFASPNFNINVASGTGVTYQWTNSNTGIGLAAKGTGYITGYSAPNNVSGSPIMGSIWVKATLNGCIGDSTNFSMTVNPIPLVTKPTDQTWCAGDVVPAMAFSSNVTVSPPDAVLYTWETSNRFIANPALPFSVSDTTHMRQFRAATNTTGGNLTGLITVTGTATIGGYSCTSAAQSYTISVRPTPVITVPTTDITVCPGQPVNIPYSTTNTNDPNVNITWSMNNQVAVNLAEFQAQNGYAYPMSGSTNIPSFTAAQNNSTTGVILETTYTLQANISGCSGGAGSSFKVKVKPKPDVAFSSGASPFYFCHDAVVQIPAFTSSYSSATYEWKRNDGINIGIVPSNYTANPMPPFTANNTSTDRLGEMIATFEVKSKLDDCWSDPMPYSIVVRPVPQLANYVSEPVCGGATSTQPQFTLNPLITPAPVPPNDASYYKWIISNGWILESDLPDPSLGYQTGFLPTFTPDTTQSSVLYPTGNKLWGENPTIMTVKVTPTLNGCPGIEKDVFIQLNPLPETTIGTNEANNCVDDNNSRKIYRADEGIGTAGSKYIWNIENPNPPTPLSIQPQVDNATDSLTYAVILFPVATPWTGDLTVVEKNTFHCLGQKKSYPLSVIPTPVVDAGNARTICYGDTVILNGKLIRGGTTGNVLYEWLPGYYMKDPPSEKTLQPHMTPSSTVQMRLRAIEGKCVGQFDTVTIAVLQSPLAPMVPARAYCESDKLMKMSTVNATDVMHWDRLEESLPGVWDVPVPIDNSTDSLSVSMNLQAAHPNALPSYPIVWPSSTDQEMVIRYQTYQTRVVGSLICKSPVAQTQLTINRTPEAPVVDKLEYCFNGNYPFYTLSASSGEGITWYNATKDTIAGYGSNVNVPLPGFVSTQISTGPPPTYTSKMYYATSTSGHGCPSDFMPAPLTIFPNPALDFSLNALGGCSPFDLEATNTSTDVNNYYTWQWSSVDFSDTIQAPRNTMVEHTYTLPTNANYVQTPRLQLIGKSKYNKDSKTNQYCSSIKEQMLTISPGVIADFFVNDTVGCSALQVYFNSTSTGAINTRWYWDAAAAPPWSQGSPPQVPSDTPGDPWYGTQGSSPYNLFDNTTKYGPKRYHVWMQVDNNYCVDNKDVIISVYSVPGALFKHNVPSSGLCPPDSVMFTNQSENMTVGNSATDTWYVWNYADGSVDTSHFEPTKYHKYESWNQSSPKQYRVDLTAFNRYTLSNNTILACSSVANQYFLVNPQLQAAFTGDSAGCAPATARFQTQSVGSISKYTWKWGDGTPDGNGSNPSHTYAELPPTNIVKPYRVTLTAQNSWCKDTVSRLFHLYPTPVSSYTVDKITGCQPLTVTFTNTSNTATYPNPANGMTYTYEYGDGYADTKYNTDAVIHIFTNTLGTNLPMSPTLTARRDFGNGFSCSKSFSLGITILPYVKADFTMEDTIGCSGKFTTKFYNASQGYNDYVYDFGDGTTKPGSRTDGIRTEHTYTNSSMYQAVTYNVTLTVNAGQLCPDAITKQVIVLGQPTADFRPGSPYPADYTYPAAPIQIDNLVRLPDRDHLKYLWSWSEQGSGYVNNFSTSEYPSPLRISDWGSFDITQRVTADYQIGTKPDTYTCLDSKTLTINIVPPAPFANFDAVPPACMPYEVTFNNTSRFAKAYKWDFGDGYTSYDENPTHIFTDAGTYKVVLTATGDGLLSKSDHTEYVVVHPLPQAGFDVQPNFLWVGQALRAFNYTSHQLSNGTPYNVWYRWDWGDNTPKDTVENPSHMYLKAGTYSITLTTGTYTNPQCVTTLTKANAVDLENAGDIILPNIFKPSAAGEPSDEIQDRGYKNYLFYPPVLSPTRKYHFMIFTRWGQLLFETTSPTRGWNGYFKGRLCDEGVYIYKVEGVFETGQSFSKMGDVTLLR